MEMIPKQYAGIFKEIASAMKIADEEFDQGFEQLNYGLLALAIEVARAESQGIGLKDAVSQADKFPLMTQVHLGLKDILSLDVPMELVPQAIKARDVIAKTAPVESIRYALAEAACMLPENTPQRALARFVLFEAVRFNLLVASWFDRTDLAYADIGDSELSRIAEDKVKTLIEARTEVFENLCGPVRPLNIVVAAALDELTDKLDLTAHGESVTEWVREMCDARAAFEEKVNKLPPQDELLVRNRFAPAFGEQRLTHEHLVRMHPVIFHDAPSSDALNKRLSRARKRIENSEKGMPSNSDRRTMVDLFALLEGE